MASRTLTALTAAVLCALWAGCGSDDPPESTAPEGPLLIHRVSCFCTPEYLTTTTIKTDGRATVRFGKGADLKPVRFELDPAEVAEIEDALAEVDFSSLPRRIKRGDGAGLAMDAREIEVTHDGHTVSEPTYIPPRTGPGAEKLPEPLPFVLAPVDNLIKEQLRTHVPLPQND